MLLGESSVDMKYTRLEVIVYLKNTKIEFNLNVK